MDGSWSKRVLSVARPWQERGQTFAPASLEDLPAAKTIGKYSKIARMLGIETPFFLGIVGSDDSHVSIEGKGCLNFAWCDYLGLNRHPSLAQAAHAATEQYGTCVSASRMVSGETLLHRELEKEIASFLGVEGALLFVSGHAANVSTIASLMGEGDLILHDEFVHNSAVMGTRLSGAEAASFRHNDLDQLEQLLQSRRARHKHAMVVVEGLYSTAGDTPDLARLIALKERYGALLMVDDAHGLGVLGATGRGCAEHCGVDPRKVDVWMGTLSKTLASCGGYIAGSPMLIDILRYHAPGFVYSVGLPPAMTAAALAALRVMAAEPERVTRLRAHGQRFLAGAKELGLDTAGSQGLGMLPVIAGDMARTTRLWHRVFARSLNPSMIIYPGVPMKAGRLRFFLTSEHTEAEIDHALAVTAEENRKL